MSLQEARAHGLPILAVDAGHVAAHFEPGANGILFDRIDGLADGFMQLARDERAMRQLFDRARGTPFDASYTWEAAALSLSASPAPRERMPEGSRSTREIAVEQHVVAEIEAASAGTKRVVESIDGGKTDAWPPLADEDRADRHVQPIEHASFEETRDRDPAPFDENATEAVARKRFDDRSRRQHAPFGLDLDDFRTPDAFSTGARAASANDDRRRGVLLKQPPPGREPQRRIDDDARGVVSGHEARRELRIVTIDRRRPDDDRVGQSAQPVHMLNVFRAGHVARRSRRGSDLRIEALPHVGEHQARLPIADAERKVEVEHLRDRRRDVRGHAKSGLAVRIHREKPHLRRHFSQLAPPIEGQPSRASERLSGAGPFRQGSQERPCARLIEHFA